MRRLASRRRAPDKKAAGQASSRKERENSTRARQNSRPGKEKNRTRTRREGASIHTREPDPKRARTAHVHLFYNPRMQISGSQKPGGRSHTRPLVGRKRGVYLPGSRHLHTRFSLFLDERLGGSENPPPFSAMTGVRRKKNGEAMFCGWRKMAGGAMLARE